MSMSMGKCLCEWVSFNVYGWVSICMGECLWIWVSVYVYGSVYMCMGECPCIWVSVHVWVSVYVCVWESMCVDECLWVIVRKCVELLYGRLVISSMTYLIKLSLPMTNFPGCLIDKFPTICLNHWHPVLARTSTMSFEALPVRSF